MKQIVITVSEVDDATARMLAYPAAYARVTLRQGSSVAIPSIVDIAVVDVKRRKGAKDGARD